MKRFFVSLICVIMAVCIFAPPFYVCYADGDGLVIHFLDVGQGDSCIIELPGDKTMLIDAGVDMNDRKRDIATEINEYIRQNIKTNGKTISFFDYVIMTHSDSDHVGSMAGVLENYHAKTLYRPNQMCAYEGKDGKCIDKAFEGEEDRNKFWGTPGSQNTATYHKALEAAYRYSDEVIVTNPYDKTQNKLVIGECTIDFYSPLSSSYTDDNNYSPIMVLEYMGVDIVLTGDAEKKNELEFADAVKAGVEERYRTLRDLSADVIKLGHHGSSTSSNEEYLDIVTKLNDRADTLVVISCGQGNSYGHPHAEVLERLNKMGFSEDRILRTDQIGNIVISVEEIDGSYAAVYNELKSGIRREGPITSLINVFNNLNTPAKIVFILIVAVILATIVIVAIKHVEKAKRRRR